ncbi:MULTISPECIES: GntR family transcriptional regulator [unclassified Hwanghaeella]|jgi:DNA-binding GntR family transcriptional regulator|uniref:GntR family transcriptional regulator n=1 Tax=unclassified Hwanghaeella TaxID=2605944 RepID=UPI003B6797C1|tara:strand:- start:708 stop:1409 length:702 start_codon:yes stop_codon:yes gene_type:complete
MATTTDESRFRSRTSETFTRIREDVISGKFAPGTKLKIEEIARALDVGATPVREALSSLSSDGLVVRQDQRGFRVAEISASEFGELLDIRCLVEERALRLAIERGEADWVEGIVLARHRLKSSSRSGEFDLEWERCHKSFHIALIAACGSSILLRLCNQFFDENNRYRSIARTSSSDSRDVGCEHEAITDAVLARDADLAVTLLLQHYRRTGKMLQDALISKAQSSLSDAGTS